MFPPPALAFAAVLLAAAPALGQSHGHSGHGHGDHSRHQPYAGLEKRPVKALSAEELDDLRAGRGMGLALAAELNGYPGPMHVLEHADALHLTAEQKAKVEQLFQEMREEAIAAGASLIAAETHLDALFAGGRADPDSLDDALRRIAHARMELRLAHLRHHLSTKAVLSPEQVAAYNRLRGYAVN